MALVDYSDSDSEPETVTKPTAPPPQTTTAKQPVQKVVDRSNPRKIVVSLPGASTSNESKPSTAGNGDEPSVKRAKTGGGAFSGFASFLPPPKNAGKAATVASSAAKTAPRRPGINLKTGAAPGFSRNTDQNDYEDGEGSTSQQQAQPSIPAGQKPADEVKLVGKPMMFKPLSVSRKPTKKKNSGMIAKTAAAATTNAKASLATGTPSQTESQPAPESAEPPKKKKKISLFSVAHDEPADAAPASTGAYEPMFTSPEVPAEAESAAAFAAYDAQHGAAHHPGAAAASSTASLDHLAAGMNLSKAARRELFGRSGAPDASAASSSRVIDFNTDKEYAHNEELRASGEQQTFNPVRAIAPGKHSLRQLVTQVHNQREALEESFAKGKSNQREAGSRYGWR
ncbi:hypothetical protein PG993_001137 [Apiospora rasikravindrae]|uniref:Mitotic checkpoint regulator, MAD2B-interacting-domain-containing protein n=1 Tax=Apiospora rasikravindrae TaxID=990691 RepID=A0ABR1UCU2_9PEZI